jgi:hypothetical protein
MTRFRKRPVEIAAVRYTGKNIHEVWDTFGSGAIYGPGGMYSRPPHSTEDRGAYIETLEGVLRVDPGDWIIRGIVGELYPCKPDIFNATYEAVAT